MTKKLIYESDFFKDYEVIAEETNLNTGKKYYIHGPYCQYGVKNKNGRFYQEHEMIKEIERYINENVTFGNAGGELEHSSSPQLDLRLVADKIISLKQEGNYFIGKSLVLSTPNGQILKNLIDDGFKFGRSTRALGQIKENKDGANIVEGFQLIAVDSVQNPSMPTAWVNGILESKEFICNSNGLYQENFDKFEKAISKYPSKHRAEINQYLLECVKKLTKSW